MNRILMSMVVVFCCSALAQAQDAPKQSPLEFTVGETKIKFYGFVRVDIQYDDSKAQDPQVIQWILSEDSSVAPTTGKQAHSGDSTLVIHPKLTRFGFDVTGTPIESLGGARASAKIEIDFFGTTTSESRDALRMRHAFGRLGWDSTALIFGQTYDVVAPLNPIVNNDMVMWNAGNMGDRRPQIRFEWWNVSGETRILAQIEIGLTGANDAQNLDGAAGSGNATNLDGIDSGSPTIQARLAYQGSHFWMDRKKWEVALSFHTAKEELPEGAAKINNQDSWTSSAIALDITLPLADGLELQGEYFTGKNLDDVRAGIGQGVNTVAGDSDQGEEIEATGGWFQLGYNLSDMYTLYVGYSFDDPKDGLPSTAGVANAFKDKNTVIYLGNRFKANANLTLGFDYLNWKTTWTGGIKDGQDNRIDIFAQWNF